MTVSYNYGFAANFPSGIHVGQLSKEIDNNTTITTHLEDITHVGDDVDIYFITSLSPAEETELTSVVIAHTPLNTNNKEHVTFTTTTNNTATYEIKVTFNYNGAIESGTLGKVYLKSYADSSVTDYSIRLFDYTNNQTIFEETYSNVDQEIHEITTLSNIPDNMAVFELQAKTNGDGKSYILSLELEYN